MQINLSYDSSVDDAPAGFKAAVQYAANVLDAAFSNNVTLNIDVGWGEIGGSALNPSNLSESETQIAPRYTYSQVVGALEQAASQPNASQYLITAAQTLSGLPDPTDGGPFDLGLAEAQALGLAPNNPTAFDGWIGFAADASEWSTSITTVPAANKYYLVGEALHELTEVMGRNGDIGKEGDHYDDAWGVPDLFRFSASGERSLGPGPGHSTAYFSIDNGVTKLGIWNNHGGSDFDDWNANGNQAGGGGPGPGGNDAFNDFSNPGVFNKITNTDLTLMQVLGWTPSEPDNFVLKGEMYYVPSGQVEQNPLLIMAGGTVDIADGGSITGTITFHGEGGQLIIEGDTPPTNGIGGFKVGDAIDFKGAPIGPHSVTLSTDNVLTIVEHGQTYQFLFDPNQDFSGQKFVVAGDGSGGTEIYIEPTLTTVGSPSPGSSPSSTAVAVTGPDITNGSGDINAGHVVTFALNTNTDVFVDTTNGTPTLSLNDGEVATYSGGSGSQALTFTYTVANGDNTPALAITGVNLNGGTIQDINGNNADLSGAAGPPPGTLQIDTTPPTLTGATQSGSSWVLSFSEPVMANTGAQLVLLGHQGVYDANATAALHNPNEAVFDFSSMNAVALPQPGHELTGVTDLAGNAPVIDLAATTHTSPVFAVQLIFSEIAAEYAAGHAPSDGAQTFHLLV